MGHPGPTASLLQRWTTDAATAGAALPEAFCIADEAVLTTKRQRTGG